MKILLIGEHYSDNLGDGVICANVEEMVKKNFNEVQITKLDLSHRLDFAQEYNNFILSKKKINKLKLYLKNNSAIYEYLSNLKRNRSTLKDFDVFLMILTILQFLLGAHYFYLALFSKFRI